MEYLKDTNSDNSWGKLFFSLAVGMAVAVYSFLLAQNTSKPLPGWEDLIYVKAVVVSVEYNSRVIAVRGTMRSGYYMVCLDKQKGCFKYFPSASWRNVREVLKIGNVVEFWVWGGHTKSVWQFKYENKILDSFKIKKWEIEGNRKVFKPMWYSASALGSLLILVTFVRVGKKLSLLRKLSE